MLLSLFVFDSSVILFCSTMYLGFKYRQLSMFIKSWLLFIYIEYGFFGLLSHMFGCCILFFVIYKQRCMQQFRVLNKYLKIDEKINTYWEYIMNSATELMAKFDEKFNLDPVLETVDLKLNNMYKVIYDVIHNLSPFVALRLKSWFDHLGEIIKIEDNYLEVKPTVVEHKPSVIDVAMSYLKKEPEDSKTDEINGLLSDISNLTEVLTKLDN